MTARSSSRERLVQLYRRARTLGYRGLGPLDALFLRMNRISQYPPIHLRRQVGCLGDPMGAGPEFVAYLKLLAGLTAGQRLWDVGCGCGFLALALEQTGWQGELLGTDIHRPSIEWAQRTISRRVPQFRFVHADIHNAAYWPVGRLSAVEWLTGFAGGDFDLVMAKSLFTHLLPDEVDLYLEAIAARLRPSGRALITCFVLNDAQQALEPRNQIRFTRVAGAVPYGVRYLNAPTAATAYDEAYLLDRLARAGLVLSGDIRFGYWTGRADGCSFQDILLVGRRP